MTAIYWNWQRYTETNIDIRNLNFGNTEINIDIQNLYFGNTEINIDIHLISVPNPEKLKNPY